MLLINIYIVYIQYVLIGVYITSLKYKIMNTLYFFVYREYTLKIQANKNNNFTFLSFLPFFMLLMQI
jgi:hypothetical protein